MYKIDATDFISMNLLLVLTNNLKHFEVSNTSGQVTDTTALLDRFFCIWSVALNAVRIASAVGMTNNMARAVILPRRDFTKDRLDM